MKKERLESILAEQKNAPDTFKRDGWMYFIEVLPEIKIDEVVKPVVKPKVEVKAEPKVEPRVEVKEVHKKVPSKASIFKNHR